MIGVDRGSMLLRFLINEEPKGSSPKIGVLILKEIFRSGPGVQAPGMENPILVT